MKRILLLLLLISGSQSMAQEAIESYFNRNLSAEQLKADFEIFRTGLEKIHPGLYRYNSKVYMDSVFQHYGEELDQEMNILDFFRNVALAVAEIKCQHTVATPASEILSMIEKEGKFLPLGTFWEFDPVAAYVANDLSSEGKFPPGSKILDIDGRSMEEIYKTLIAYFPSDGEILTNKQSRLMYGLELHMWYYLLIGHPDRFELRIETPDAKVVEIEYDAVTVKQLIKNYKRYISQKDPDLKAYFDYWKEWNRKHTSQTIRHEFIRDNTALLTVGNFHSHKFEKLMEEAFQEISEREITNLIIDVRGNEGGSDILGRKLFSYLIEKPTAYFDSLYSTASISDTTFLFSYTDKNREWYFETLPLVNRLPDGRFATKPEVNQGLLLQEPAEHAYKGDIYVLMNGRSASTTSEFTAATHFNKLATFIGEESGGAYHGGNGGDFAQLLLPNSNISVQIPLSRYVMNSSDTSYVRRGTIPDFEVGRTMEDVLQGKDPQLEFAIQLIEGN